MSDLFGFTRNVTDFAPQDVKLNAASIFADKSGPLPGFVDNIESLNPATGQFSCMTLWKTASDVENYNNGLFKEVASSLIPLMQGNPTVQTLPVENSSAHHLKAGKAAA